MRLTHLSLRHFRNYRELELDFSDALTLFQGQNAQGKTNLLEAIYFLATSKPVHAQVEREIVDWAAVDEPIPYTRVAARILAASDDADRPQPTELEIILTPRGDGVNYTKSVKINGVAKRSMDLIGLLQAVLFLPEDIKLVDGSPGERRRYLDIALCQMDRHYCRALSAYQKIVTQRNSLLKTLRERNVPPTGPGVDAQIRFWDEQLVRHGATIMARRHHMVRRLEAVAQERHRELTDGREELGLRYLPSFDPGLYGAAGFARLREGEEQVTWGEEAAATLTPTEVAEHFTAKLQSRRSREIAAGVTLYGPHRDDLRFLANGRDLRTYGSRGQQRSAALSLKLGEVQLMTEESGTPPLLLLDDVMSELDAVRRGMLLRALGGVSQAILTTTDWDDFSVPFRRRSRLFHVQGGAVASVTLEATGVAPAEDAPLSEQPHVE